MNDSTKELEWTVTNLHDGLTPSIEIKSTDDLANCFPIAANFKLDYTLLGVDVERATFIENKNNLLFKFNKSCIAKDEDFKIVYD